jgi:hypothetical protein
MSLDDVFALFGFSGENSKNKEIKKELEEFKNTPYFKIGMFTKMILNGVSFKKQIIGFFSKADNNLDIAGVDEAGDFMMFNRAWYWICGCDIKKKIWKEALIKNATPELVGCLKAIIKYFENIEEYEKCSMLIKIQAFVEKEIFNASLRDT